MAKHLRVPLWAILVPILFLGCGYPGDLAPAGSGQGGAESWPETVLAPGTPMLPLASGARSLVLAEPCEGDDDCGAGACVQVGGGRICTVACASSCPGDWQCTDVSRREQELRSLCLPGPEHFLCQPCLDDTECVGHAGVSRGSFCLDYGPQEGRFCGIACGAERRCPEAFTCVEVEGDGGRPSGVWQCVAEAGSCDAGG